MTLKELDIQYITFNGYYSNKDDGEELNAHTEETWELYCKGLELHDVTGDNQDVMDGVFFDEVSGKPIADWWIDGETKYVEIN